MKSGKQTPTRGSKRRRASKSGEASISPDPPRSDEKYRVGPNHPPREFQFKPGVSGNPKGAKPKSKLLRDLGVLFARTLSKKVKLPRGERAKITSNLEAGFNELATQFAKGDHRARRDVFEYSKKLGIDLTASRSNNVHRVEVSSESELRQALLDRGIPARLLPPTDEVGLEPPPDPPLPPDSEEEPHR